MAIYYKFPEKHNRTVRNYYNAIIKLVEEGSAENISVQMILDETMTSRSTFYAYFQDKYALINYVGYYDLHQCVGDLFESRQSCLEQTNAFYDCVYEKRVFYKKILQLQGECSFREFYINYWRDYSRKIFLAKLGTEKYEKEKMKFQLISYIEGMIRAVYAWIESDCITMTTRELSEFSLRFSPFDVIFKEEEALHRNAPQQNPL